MIVNNVVPMVIEKEGFSERAYDIYSLLLKGRIIMLGSEINAPTANLTIAQLLYLNREDNKQPIQLYVSSPGGEVYPGLGIYDTMQQVSAPVNTVAVGRTASFGTVILTAGTKGMRHALPHATIHMHQPSAGTQGQVTDMMIHVNEYMRLKQDLIDIFVRHTGQDREIIERDTERDIFLSAEQAVEYGLIDSILTERQVDPAVYGQMLTRSNGNGHR